MLKKSCLIIVAITLILSIEMHCADNDTRHGMTSSCHEPSNEKFDGTVVRPIYNRDLFFLRGDYIAWTYPFITKYKSAVHTGPDDITDEFTTDTDLTKEHILAAIEEYKLYQPDKLTKLQIQQIQRIQQIQQTQRWSGSRSAWLGAALRATPKVNPGTLPKPIKRHYTLI